ncbi:MAG: DNA translocase FtsK 4TM domain-containing protein [Deltaproteobacteria bacterium]|nr:DNA translocase FtsK 4TM domain-containing protein [Deltaproteobacteria bacterium]
MRKEIIGIIFFFLVLLTLISLFSYSPHDPSIHHATSSKQIENFFGLFGAHFAGILVGLFGLGAFWFPLILLFASIHFFGGHSAKSMAPTLFGGVLLVITTGSLFAIYGNYYSIFGSEFSSGGIIGIPLKLFLVKFCNNFGAALVLILLWLIGIIMSTGFSMINFIKQCRQAAVAVADRIKTFYVNRPVKREKKKKRETDKNNKAANKKREITIRVNDDRPVKTAPPNKEELFGFMRDDNSFKLPSINFLDDFKDKSVSCDDENLRVQSKLLEKKLEDFGVHGKVVTVSPGPVVTTFEYKPAPGVKISKVVNLGDDLSLALKAISIRIVAPIPGKAAIGIEVPNASRQMVTFKDVVISKNFEKMSNGLALCLGKDIVGNPVVTDLAKMPHLLIAGATGTGKSVGLNAMICSLLYKANPDEVKLIMVDPKRIELSMYDGIPHLITPVVTDVKKATNALFWAVQEMEKRYELLAEKKVRNIRQYNHKINQEDKNEDGERPEKLPFIVIIIDELADLMMVTSKDVEIALTRLAQMARAAGLHLILATQRPSVDVLTGIIKANFPARLTFQVSSRIDSRTILDANGAETLLGDGDMLLLPPGTSKLQRVHGAYISEGEITRIVDFLKSQKKPDYNMEVTKVSPGEKDLADDEEHDERYDDAVAFVTKTGRASISMIQRQMRIGYNRAARIIEMMEREGIVGPSDGAKPREVLVRGYEDM